MPGNRGVAATPDHSASRRPAQVEPCYAALDDASRRWIYCPCYVRLDNSARASYNFATNPYTEGSQTGLRLDGFVVGAAHFF